MGTLVYISPVPIRDSHGPGMSGQGISRSNFDDRIRPMCLKRVFNGPRDKSSKKTTGKGFIRAVFHKNCTYTVL